MCYDGAVLARGVALGLLLGLAGCGSRTALLEPSAGTGGSGGGATGGVGGSVGGSGGSVGGSGGSVGGFGGSVGGFGGSVGGSTACDTLESLAPIIDVEHPAPFDDRAPKLTASSDDGTQISVAFQRQHLKNPGAKQQVHASLSPWQSWPSGTLSPTYTTFASPDLDPDFAVGPGANNHFALLVSHSSLVDSFAPAVEPSAADPGPNLTLSSAGAPVFVAKGPSIYHLVGDSNGNMLMGHVVGFPGGSFSATDFVLACGKGVTAADAVAYQGGWLVALANEPTAPPTGCSAAANGAMRLDVLQVGVDGSVTPVASHDGNAPIVQIAVAPHPSGAWVVWRVMSGGAVAPIRWLRVDATSFGVIGPGDVSGPGDMPLDGFDATALGTRLAVVWGNDPAGNPPDLTVSLLDETGGKLTQAFLQPPFFGPLAGVASSNGNGLVVGWHEPASDGGGAVVKLARFDCYGAL